jgi:hypothetical protein
MPVFGTLAVQGMLEDMRDICTQLLQKASGLFACSFIHLTLCLTSGNGTF